MSEPFILSADKAARLAADKERQRQDSARNQLKRLTSELFREIQTASSAGKIQLYKKVCILFWRFWDNPGAPNELRSVVDQTTGAERERWLHDTVQHLQTLGYLARIHKPWFGVPALHVSWGHRAVPHTPEV